MTDASRGRAGGFGDWLPGAAGRRRGVGDALLGTFEAWGYGLVATPLVEPVDTIAAGVGAGKQTQLFRFMDADGSLLALVGERTVSVARVVATQLREGPFPLRLCYLGPVLRNQPLLGGRRRETLQAGCELIGAPGVGADAECVGLAADALGRAGVTAVQIDVGHADFLPGLLEGAGLDEATQERVLGALRDRDLVAVEAALQDTPVGEVERSLLLRFPALRGDREILDAAASGLRALRPRRALDELGELWDLLVAHGLAGSIHLDLGAVRDWDYYTGPTFELFTGDLGFPLGVGGRYDTLLSRLGLVCPATGFVLAVDRCCDVLARRDGSWTTVPDALRLGFAEGAAALAVGVARRLRAAGLRVAGELESRSKAPGGDLDVFVAGPAETSWRDASGWQTGSVDEAVIALAVPTDAARRTGADRVGSGERR